MIWQNETRRGVLAGLAASGVIAAAAPGLTNLAFAQGAALAPTPACDDDDDPTPAQTEGPFFTPNSPERAVLREAGMAGMPMTLIGFVVGRSCRPVPGALVELWHADDAGNYDIRGYRLRGHQFTDALGRYQFETIVPGLYPGRTRHFHAKYQAANRPVLTTQLYFPGEAMNERDGIFSPELLLTIATAPDLTGSFVTVLDLP